MNDKPVLRKLEVLVQHHPSFLFWNVKGALAERWGHGPDFDAVTDQGNQIILNRAPGDQEQKDFVAAMAGIAVSSFTWELPPHEVDAIDLALAWLGDCLTAMDPKVLVRLQASQRWLIPLSEPSVVQKRLSEQQPGLEAFVPKGYGSPFTGSSFNATINEGNLTGCIVGTQIGITRPGMPLGFAKADQIDDQVALGLFVDLLKFDEAGISSGQRVLGDICKRLSSDVHNMLSIAISRFIRNG